MKKIERIPPDNLPELAENNLLVDIWNKIHEIIGVMNELVDKHNGIQTFCNIHTTPHPLGQCDGLSKTECKHIYGYSPHDIMPEPETVILITNKNFLDSDDTIFKFCPFCGKKLK